MDEKIKDQEVLKAEAGGFEPPVRLPVRQFSKLLVSATHPHFLDRRKLRQPEPERLSDHKDTKRIRLTNNPPLLPFGNARYRVMAKPMLRS